MPLSEEELRLLEQMERALSEEDPKFASTLRGTSLRRAARRRAILAGVVFVVGICVLMGGVISKVYAVGIIGFVIMLASATIGLNALKGQQAAAAAETQGAAAHPSSGFTVIDGGRAGRSARAGKSRGGRPSRRPRKTGTFMERAEERWRRRREQNGGF